MVPVDRPQSDTPPGTASSIAAVVPSRRTFGWALLGAMVHAAVVVALWSWFEFSTNFAPLEASYVAVGAASLGAVPAALFATKRLVSPAAIVAGALVLSAYGTWSVYVAPSTPPAPVDPTPFGWYVLGWVVVTAAALVAGGCESGLRRLQASG